MKKAMLIILAGMFSLSMFAQTQEKAKPVEQKKEPAKTEVAKPAASKEEAKPATKNASKHATKEAAKPTEKKDVPQPKK